MKKIAWLMMLSLFLMVFIGNQKVWAADSKMILDGQEIALPVNADIRNKNGNIMIPLRVVVENLGFKVKWDQKTRSVQIMQEQKTIALTVDKLEATVDGEILPIAEAPLLDKSTVYVPIRFVSEQMGIDVKWDNTTKTVTLTSPVVSDEETPPVDSGIPAVSTGAITSADTSGDQAVIHRIDFIDNKFTVQYEGNLIPSASMVTAPDRIVLDLKNASFGTSFASIHPLNEGQTGMITFDNQPDVKSIRYSLFSKTPSTIRFVLDMNSSKPYRLTGGEPGSNLLTIDLNPQVDSPEQEFVDVPEVIEPINPTYDGKRVVVIDAGHGDHDPGAISVTKKKEKEFTLALSLKVEALLLNEPDLAVVLTRSDDTYLKLAERAKIANDLQADVFVSIHGNSNESSAANGTETFYTRNESKDLAAIIHKHVSKATGFKNRGANYANYHVTRETKMPAVLLEIGFLSNGKEESQMYSENFQQIVAQAIVDGIKEYLAASTAATS